MRMHTIGNLALSLLIAGCGDEAINLQAETPNKIGNYADNLDPATIEMSSPPSCRAFFGSPGSETVVLGQIGHVDRTNQPRTCALDIAYVMDDVRRNFAIQRGTYGGQPLMPVPDDIGPLRQGECVVELRYFPDGSSPGDEGSILACSVTGTIRPDTRDAHARAIDPLGSFACDVHTWYDVNDCLTEYVGNSYPDGGVPPVLEPFAGEDREGDPCHPDNPNRNTECI